VKKNKSTSRFVISIGSNIPKNYTHLKAARYDAIDIYNLISWNWECDTEHRVLLTGSEATTQNANIAINELLTRHATSEDYILIFLSGHIEPNIRKITGSFITSDFSKELNNLGINLRSLRYAVEESLAKYVLVIIDGCHSGLVAQGKKTTTSHWFYFTTGEMDSEINTKLFITAVSSGEFAFEREDQRNSEFTELAISIIRQSLRDEKSLSISLFYDELAKRAIELNIASPVRSGIEIGYSELILAKDKKSLKLYSEVDSKEVYVHIPKWLQQVIDIEKKDYNPDDDLCIFICDNNFPDGSILMIGEKITKSWRIKNAGKISWKNRFLKMVGESRGAGRIHGNKLTPISTVEPREEIDINFELRMPPYPGSVYAEFKMVDASGNILFPNRKGLYVHFDVVQSNST